MAWTPGNGNGTAVNNGQFALTGTSVGDLIVVAMTDGASADYSDSPPTDDKGNTYQLIYGISSYNFQSVYVWMAINVGSGTVNIDCADSGTFQSYVGHAVTPPAGTVVVDVARDNIESAASGTDNVSSGTGTCHSADGYGIGVILNDGTAGTLTAGTGWTQRNQQAGGGLNLMIESKAVTAGSVQALASFNAPFTGAAVLIVFATDISQTSQQIAIAADADDASAYRTATTWTGIDSATLNQEPDSTKMYVNQEFTSPNYYKEEMYLRFDTSAIPADAIIQWARLLLYPTAVGNTEGLCYLLGDYYDFGGAPVVSGDWKGSGSQSASIFARHDPGKWAVASAMPINIRDISGIKRSGETNAEGATGITGIRIFNGYTGATPTSVNLWEFASREYNNATDNFNRASGPLGSNWTQLETVGSFVISSNTVATPSSLPEDAAAYWDARTFADDQYAQAAILNLSDNGSGCGYGVALRASGAAGSATYYRCFVNQGGTVRFDWFGSDTWGGTIATRSTTWNNGDILRLEAEGSTFRIYQNGVQLGASITDTNISSGKPGIAYSSAAFNGDIDNWEGGDLVSYEPKLEVFWHETTTTPLSNYILVPPIFLGG